MNGPAMGGGFDLALLCDMRIASTAADFGHPEIKFGAPPLFTPLRWIVGAASPGTCVSRGARSMPRRRIAWSGERGRGRTARGGGQVAARQIAEAPQRALQTTKRYLTAVRASRWTRRSRSNTTASSTNLMLGAVGRESHHDGSRSPHIRRIGQPCVR